MDGAALRVLVGLVDGLSAARVRACLGFRQSLRPISVSRRAFCPLHSYTGRASLDGSFTASPSACIELDASVWAHLDACSPVAHNVWWQPPRPRAGGGASYARGRDRPR